MNRKLADDLARTNAEFEKLKSGRLDDETPREALDREERIERLIAAERRPQAE
jgi:hypothetical protein